MKRWISIAVLCLFVMPALFAGVSDDIAQADAMYDDEQYIEGFEFLDNLLPSIDGDGDKAEVYWRLSRFKLFITDDEEREGTPNAELLKMFVEGREFAEKAIELKPSADAYYWKSSNVGRWGETKGILDSLFKADPMKKDLYKVIEYDKNYADAWYVFGRLHMLLPGWPLSFGNSIFAVSFTRRAIDVYDGDDLKFSYYKSLAENLRKRNWKAKDRKNKIKGETKNFNKKTKEFEKMQYFEGSLGYDYSPVYTDKELQDMSDHEESVIILNWLINEYDAMVSPSQGDTNTIEEIEELLAEWT